MLRLYYSHQLLCGYLGSCFCLPVIFFNAGPVIWENLVIRPKFVSPTSLGNKPFLAAPNAPTSSAPCAELEAASLRGGTRPGCGFPASKRRLCPAAVWSVFLHLASGMSNMCRSLKLRTYL